jgi:TonB family protein
VRQLQRFKRYPPEAQSRNEQGVVLLGFTLDRNGHVLAHNIARSSGYADLDNDDYARSTAAVVPSQHDPTPDRSYGANPLFAEMR